jgi:hypothetical protein
MVSKSILHPTLIKALTDSGSGHASVGVDWWTAIKAELHPELQQHLARQEQQFSIPGSAIPGSGTNFGGNNFKKCLYQVTLPVLVSATKTLRNIPLQVVEGQTPLILGDRELQQLQLITDHHKGVIQGRDRSGTTVNVDSEKIGPHYYIHLVLPTSKHVMDSIIPKEAYYNLLDSAPPASDRRAYVELWEVPDSEEPAMIDRLHHDLEQQQLRLELQSHTSAAAVPLLLTATTPWKSTFVTTVPIPPEGYYVEMDSDEVTIKPSTDWQLPAGITAQDLCTGDPADIPPEDESQLSAAILHKWAELMHSRLGHSGKGHILLEMLGRSKAAKSLLKIQQTCAYCIQHRARPPNSKYSQHLHQDFNDVISWDILQFKEFQYQYAIHIVDHATRFSVCCLLPSRHMKQVARQVLLRWVLLFGSPVFIIHDAGQENQMSHPDWEDMAKQFMVGTIAIQVPAQAHWMVRVESHHKVLRRYVELLARDTTAMPTSARDPDILLQLAVLLKNMIPKKVVVTPGAPPRYYSPYLELLGFTPNIQGISATAAHGTRELLKALASEARKHQDITKLQKAKEDLMHRPLKSFHPGDHVWVYVQGKYRKSHPIITGTNDTSTPLSGTKITSGKWNRQPSLTSSALAYLT